MDTIDRFRGCLIVLAVGDAVGTTVEFQRRGSFQPLTDMAGGGPLGLQPGQWTDDTSMALCLAASLVEARTFDPRDQMERYCRWYEQGYMSSTGKCFDIGNTTRTALMRYRHSGDPFSGSNDTFSAGNGSIMRLAPVALFYFPELAQMRQYAAESSRTTHGAQECLEACRLLAEILYRALMGMDKREIVSNASLDGILTQALRDIAQGSYINKRESEIKGSGYVVKSLEAALWCFWKTGSFREAILTAANLGDDADTTAAICGQVAGVYYGESGIPTSWMERLAKREDIRKFAEDLYNHRRI